MLTTLSNDELKGLIAQVSGAEEAMNRLITGTFNALGKVADFAAADETNNDGGSSPGNGAGAKDEPPPPDSEPEREKPPGITKFTPAFRFNIEIHLPSNGTEDTYLAIFNALRKSLG